MAQAGSTFDLKAGSFTFPTLFLQSGNLDTLSEELDARVEQAPEFFRNTPVVIDLSALESGGVDFPLLVGLMRGHGMLPVGVRGGTPAQQESAELMELAVLSEARGRRPPPERTSPSASGQSEGAAAGEPKSGAEQLRSANQATIVDRPVRSGQRIYAPGGDLVVVAAVVSSGAELMADGNVHIYGTLRGRVLAGVKGNREARIFCRDLRAELVSVAGRYLISEDIERRFNGAQVQIRLDGDRLIVDDL